MQAFKSKFVAFLVVTFIVIHILTNRVVKYEIKLASMNPYSSDNMIKSVVNFKSFVKCSECIYFYMKSPENYQYEYFTVKYALSPCEVVYEAAKKVEIQKGFFLINKLHPDYDLYDKQPTVIAKSGEFMLFKPYQ